MGIFRESAKAPRSGAKRYRLPVRQEVFTVFSVAVFVVFSWSIRGFLFVFPSRVMYCGAWEVFSIFMYMMAFALVESLLVVGGLTLLGAILPAPWLRQGFPYKGFLAILVGAGAAIWYQARLGNDLPPKETLLLWAGALVAILVCLVFVSHIVPRLGQVLTLLAERFTVFAYLYLPLGLLGILVVLLRNVFSL